MKLVVLTGRCVNNGQGNVKVAGMPEDIGASDQQFSTAVSIFYGECPLDASEVETVN